MLQRLPPRLLNYPQITCTCAALSSRHHGNNNNNQNNRFLANTNNRHSVMIHKRYTSTYYYTNPLITGMQKIFETGHDVTGTPWWATIALGTFLLRGVLVAPVSVFQAKNAARVELYQPVLSEILARRRNNIVNQCRRDNLSKAEVEQRVRQDMAVCAREFYRVHGVLGGTALSVGVLLLQIPLFVTISLAMRNISGSIPGSAVQYASSPGVESGGVAWFTDLTIPDQYYVLPMLLLVTNTLTWSLHWLSVEKSSSRLMKILRRFTLGMGVFGAGVSTLLPSAISWYWLSSALCALLQHVVIKSPKVRRALGIPQTHLEKERPLKHVWDVSKLSVRQFVDKQRNRPW